MAKVSVRAFEDRSRSEGGHAAIVLRGVSRLPNRITIKLSPTDADTTSADFPWAREAIAPMACRLTDEGVLLTIGPELADSPELLPGTAVLIEVPELGVEGEFLWPSITPLARPRRRGLVTSKGARAPNSNDGHKSGRAGPPRNEHEANKSPRATVSGSNQRPAANRGQDAHGAATSTAAIDPGLGVGVEASAVAPYVTTSASAIAPTARSVVVPMTPRQHADAAVERAQRSSRPRGWPAAVGVEHPPPATAAPIDAKNEMGGEGPRPHEAPPSVIAAEAAVPRTSEHRGILRSPIAVAVLTAFALLAVQAAALLALSPVPSRILDDALAGRFGAHFTAWLPGSSSNRELPPALASVLAAVEVSPRGVLAQDLPPYTALELASQRLASGTGAYDPQEGAYWLRRYLLATLASETTRRALTRLGALEAEGHGKPADVATARRLWELSALAGDEVAMCFLARLFADGIGTRADPGTARAWRARAGHRCPDSIAAPPSAEARSKS